MVQNKKKNTKDTRLGDFYKQKHAIPHPLLCKGFEMPFIGSVWYSGGNKRKQLFPMVTHTVELEHEFETDSSLSYKEVAFCVH